MPPPYNRQHWSTFINTLHQSQGPIGESPMSWVRKFKITGIPNNTKLPNFKLTRQTVYSICQDPKIPVLFGYICVMAWGSQGSNSGGKTHVQNAWKNRTLIQNQLNKLRKGMSRKDAYNLFLCNPISGLGPSYVTKLLFFFNSSPGCYIMDQWTAKSVILLTNSKIVKMSGSIPSQSNKAGNYQAFCEEVDHIAGLLGIIGDIAEERLYSQGGRPSMPWRAYVRKNYNYPIIRYSAASMHAIYPHIPIIDF